MIIADQVLLTESRSVGVNGIRYERMLTAIGTDETDDCLDPKYSDLKATVMSVAITQDKSTPIRWTNKCVHKLFSIGIQSTSNLSDAITGKKLNIRLRDNNYTAFNQITINGFSTAIDPDFRLGRA